MVGIQNSAEKDRVWVEKIAFTVSGYKGYFDREIRRDSDRAVRDFLGRYLDKCKVLINRLSLDVTDGGDLASVRELASKLGRVIGEIRYADYGNTEFFEIIKIHKSKLSRLYKFDMALNACSENIESLISEMEEALNNGVPISDLIDQIRAEINMISEIRQDREGLILEM